MTVADWLSGCEALKKLMWLVSTRSRSIPNMATTPMASAVARTRPGCAQANRATRSSGPTR
jgi:hypothetical protein